MPGALFSAYFADEASGLFAIEAFSAGELDADSVERAFDAYAQVLFQINEGEVHEGSQHSSASG